MISNSISSSGAYSAVTSLLGVLVFLLIQSSKLPESKDLIKYFCVLTVLGKSHLMGN